MVHRLAVIQRIRELENEDLVARGRDDDSGSDDEEHEGNEESHKAEIIALSTEHGDMLDLYTYYWIIIVELPEFLC